MKLFKNFNFNKLKSGLTKTRDKLVNSISETISGKANLDDDILEELEEILITSDIGYKTSMELIEKTRSSLKSISDRSDENILGTIKNVIEDSITSGADNLTETENIERYKPYVIMVVGVNGAGKTTTIGKLAYNFKKSGLKVLIGSADTFRAAANDQLEIWAKRAGVEIIQSKSGADPSGVAYDTMEAAKATNADIVLIDTAGRLHTKDNLMNELSKIKRVIGKVIDYAPNEIYLVLDGNTGQNAIIQAETFSRFTDITGLIITKLDGTAKGGVVLQINSELNIPIKYIGVGEGIEDLLDFNISQYVDALFSK